MYTVKHYYKNLLQNAHVCSNLQQLLAAQNMQEQDYLALYCAENYMMLHTEYAANVLYFNNRKELLRAMLRMSYIMELNDNMHEMIDITKELADDAREFINIWCIECDVI